MKFAKLLPNLSKGLLVMALAIISAVAFAQGGAIEEVTVTGTIVDVNGVPVIGAAVIDPTDTSNGCISDAGGNFTINVVPGTELVVSCIGYQDTRFVANDSGQEYKIVLQEDALQLEETVVVGYAVQKKATVTGAVSAVLNKDITTTKNENVQNMLTGKIAGLRIVQKTSEPGQFNNDIDIRGFGTPLVVIDGVPRDNMARIDAEDIESISVLKDASAAIYGVRAANGVILITTKKGTKGKAEVSYSGNMTWQVPTNFPELVSAADWMTLMNEKVIHNVDGSASGTYSQEEIAAYRNGEKQGTVWKDAVFRNSAPQTSHNINISGGNDRITYFASAGYQYQESYLRSNAINYNKFNLRSNISAKIAKNVTVDLNIAGMMDERQSSAFGSYDIIYQTWMAPPLDNIWYNESEGQYASMTNPSSNNAVAMMNKDVTGYRTYKSKWLQTNASITYDLPWVKGLSVKAMYSYDYIANDNKEYTTGYILYNTSGDPNQKNYQTSAPNRIARTFYGKDHNLWQVQATYNRSFGNHNVGALLLFENQHKEGDNFSGSRQVELDMDQVFAGITTGQQFTQDDADASLYDYANQALVGRVNYDYAGKYIAEFAFRYEASSRFPSETRWGFFPSVSAGYRISEEKFWKESPLKFINNFKIRASWGILGDDSALAYQFLTGYNYPDSGYVIDGEYVNGSVSTGIPNRDITWYTAKTFNVGIDAEAWNGLLGVTAEYFNRTRTGLLSTRASSLPGVVGATLPQENLNSDRTQGFEIELSHRHHVGDFYYQIKGNVSYTRTMNLYVERSRAGNSYDNWKNNTNNRYNNITWGIEGNGRMETWDEVWHNPIYIARNSVLGDYEYLDWNGDGYFSELDKHPLVNSSSVPLLNFGLTFSGSWKGLDFSILFQGTGNRWVSPVGLLYQPLFADTNALVQFMDRWHPSDPLADPYDPQTEWVEGYYGYTGTLPDQTSDFHLQNASYIRLKNVEIGYSLPDKWMQKINMQGLRIYVSGYNLLTFTGLKYLDPEYNVTDAYSYPISRTFTLGLNIKF